MQDFGVSRCQGFRVPFRVPSSLGSREGPRIRVEIQHDHHYMLNPHYTLNPNFNRVPYTLNLTVKLPSAQQDQGLSDGALGSDGWAKLKLPE